MKNTATTKMSELDGVSGRLLGVLYKKFQPWGEDEQTDPTLWELAKIRPAEFRRWKGVGRQTFKEFRDLLKSAGLDLDDDWYPKAQVFICPHCKGQMKVMKA
jgi:hypothetical protein